MISRNSWKRKVILGQNIIVLSITSIILCLYTSKNWVAEFIGILIFCKSWTIYAEKSGLICLRNPRFTLVDIWPSINESRSCIILISVSHSTFLFEGSPSHLSSFIFHTFFTRISITLFIWKGKIPKNNLLGFWMCFKHIKSLLILSI